jgi:hypothetical protein
MRDLGRVPLNAPEVEGASEKPSPVRRVPKASVAPSYAGSVTCLRCDRCFYSWDRRQNRLCTSCREYLNGEPSDEETYTLPKRTYLPRDS